MTNADDEIRRRLDAMSLEEKVAQLSCIARTSEAEWLLSDDGIPQVEAILIRHPHGIGQLGRPSQKLPPATAAQFTHDLQSALAECGQRVGSLFNEEGVHGHMALGGTNFPAAIALASTWDPDLIESVYSSVAAEVRARGSNYVYAPVLELARDPRWGRVEETFGEDAFLVSQMGVAAVLGLQGGAWLVPSDKVLACAKHFVAHGMPQAGRNAAPVNVGERELRSEHLVPFKAVVDAGVGAIMVAYHDIDGVPCHVNKWLLTTVLRDEWGWEGMLTSDGFGMPQLATIHRAAADSAEAGRLAIEAGVDAEVPEGVCYSSLVDQVRDGRVAEAVVDRAAYRVLTAKARLGLLDPPANLDTDAVNVVNCQAHRQLARRVAQRSAILLTNEGDSLPLDENSLRSIAVIGPNAADVHLGGYSDDPGSGVSVLEGIRKRSGAAIRVDYAEGCRITEGVQGGAAWWQDDTVFSDPSEQDGRITEAVALAAASEVVVMVIGGNEATSREAWTPERRGDRDTLDLPGRQIDLLHAVAAAGKPMVAVVMGARPLDLRPVVETCQAILHVWYPGQEGGTAIADLLFGDASPSGKLPITFPRSVGQIPIHVGVKSSAARKYLASEPGPLFAFGHGLSYTTFAYAEPKLDRDVIGPDDSVTLSVEVTNTGTRPGEEVVQLYLGDRVASTTRPIRSLRGFQRVALAPGESSVVRFKVEPAHLALVDSSMQAVVEPGEFDVWVGSSSTTTLGTLLTVS